LFRVDIQEIFPIVVSLIDESTGQLATGQNVSYDIRYPDDSPLSPPISGILVESTVQRGIYKTTESISLPGQYIIYATCSGFVSSTEEVIVNPENIYTLTKQTRSYNVAVEDIIRENVVPTASQVIRKVPMGLTDYILTTIKKDSDSDWSTTTTSGSVFAWYRDLDDKVPFKMAGPF
jgi:hypothetical protein